MKLITTALLLSLSLEPLWPANLARRPIATVTVIAWRSKR